MKRLFAKGALLKAEKWLEMLVITAIVLAIGFFIDSSDPFFVNADFPWIWIAPLLIALRYGIAPGMISVALIVLSYLGMERFGLLEDDFPTNFMLGGVLLTLVCGQFSTVWNTRLRRSDQLSRHAAERFEQLSRAYFMVRLSHDRLEQNLISRPVTLRDAMIDLRTLLAARKGIFDKDTVSAIMSILVHYCTIESAAIFVKDAMGHMQPTPLAECGRGATYNPDDLLLRSAIESGNSSYQTVNRLRRDENSSYLVVVPLRTSTGELLGVLLVTEMPFLALQRETIQILSVLLAYAADHAEASRLAHQMLGAFPDLPTMFASEMIKMVRLRRDLEVNSALVLVQVQPTQRMQEICVTLERQQRGLDHSWRRDIGWGVQFVTLMPFSGATAIEGYIERLNKTLQRQFGIKLGEGDITFRSTMLAADDALHQLADLLVDQS